MPFEIVALVAMLVYAFSLFLVKLRMRQLIRQEIAETNDRALESIGLHGSIVADQVQRLKLENTARCSRIADSVDELRADLYGELWKTTTAVRNELTEAIEAALKPIHAKLVELEGNQREIVERAQFERFREQKSRHWLMDINGARSTMMPVQFDFSVWMSKAQLAEMRQWFITTSPEFTQRHLNWFIHTYLYVRVNVGTCVIANKLSTACCHGYGLSFQGAHSDPRVIRPVDDWDWDYVFGGVTGNPVVQGAGWSIFHFDSKWSDDGKTTTAPKPLTAKYARLIFDAAFEPGFIPLTPTIRAISTDTPHVQVWNALAVMPTVIQHLYFESRK